MGSGFPAHMSKLDTRVHWDPRPIDEYIVAITQELRRCFDGAPAPRLILEPGRYLVNDAIIFVSRIVSVRDRAGTQQIVCNGATTMVPFTRHRAPIIRAYRPDLTPREGPPIPSTIYGASCREDDVLFQGAIGRVVTGDYLVHFGVGAYNSSINPPFIFPCPILRFIEHGSLRIERRIERRWWLLKPTWRVFVRPSGSWCWGLQAPAKRCCPPFLAGTLAWNCSVLTTSSGSRARYACRQKNGGRWWRTSPSRPSWVMDGTYEASLDLRLPAAEAIVYIQSSRWTCLWRVVTRRLLSRWATC